ncbi:hypothetical protein KKC67_01825 [Patescibacteria group bacterium]|nr:hypothetical protein [Patescibacteria group bacterium]MBU1062983.1 hypothetical protein [Patescibacteria group bacterium]MBU1991736.1 hypothetical protein [Patescibacteria group bacterium]
MTLYRNILKQSWRTTWRNKYLWFFGIFAVLLGNAGEYKILSHSLMGDDQSILPAIDRIAQTGIFSKHALDNIFGIMSQNPLLFSKMIIIFLVIGFLICFLVWLSVVSQSAIVNSAASVIKQKEHDFQKGMDSGIKNFWQIFALNIIANVAILLILAVISLPFLFGKINIIVASLFYVILFIVFIPVAISLSLIIKYAIALTVINRNNLFDAIKLGWKLFKDNWVVSFEMALILFFINFAVGLLILFIILILAIPFLSLGLIFYFFSSALGVGITIILAFSTALLLIIISGSMLTVFQTSSWTGLFIELIKNGGTAKIVRMLGGIIKK